MPSKLASLCLLGAVCLSSLLSALPVVSANTCDAVNCAALVYGKRTITGFESKAQECVEKVSATVATTWKVHDYMKSTDVHGNYDSLFLVDLTGLRQSVFGTVSPYKGVTCFVDCQRKCPNLPSGHIPKEVEEEFKSIEASH